MVVITVEKYLNARVHTITAKNKELFSVKEMCGMFKKHKKQKTKKRTKKEQKNKKTNA